MRSRTRAATAAFFVFPSAIKNVVLSYTIFDVTDYSDVELSQHHSDDRHDGHEMEPSL